MYTTCTWLSFNKLEDDIEDLLDKNLSNSVLDELKPYFTELR
jgi:hypothetical protein